MKREETQLAAAGAPAAAETGAPVAKPAARPKKT
jgi:hypothetical protein